VFRDPFFRELFTGVAAIVIGVAVLGAASTAAALVVGLIAAVIFTGSTAGRLRSLKRRIARLTGESDEGVENQDLARLESFLQKKQEEIAEAQRRTESEHDVLMALLQATSEGLCVLDNDQRIELINDEARRHLRPSIDPLGRTLEEVTSQSELIEFLNSLRAGKSPDPCTFKRVDPAGERRIVVSGHMVHRQGESPRAILALTDETNLSRLAKARTDFVANVTHEMRSPLASILGFAETLLTFDGLEPSDVDDQLKRILRNARRLDDIIRDLIELSRLEHGTHANLVTTRIEEMFEELQESFRDFATEKEVELHVHPVPFEQALTIDTALLRQALTNLTENAIKYTPVGGRVDVKAALENLGEGRLLEMSVSDTGPGIPLEHQERIFERFYRVDSARSRALGGTGLGLAIVKHAVALHGGTVELESEPEHGSLFRMTIPLAPPTQSMAPRA